MRTFIETFGTVDTIVQDQYKNIIIQLYETRFRTVDTIERDKYDNIYTQLCETSITTVLYNGSRQHLEQLFYSGHIFRFYSVLHFSNNIVWQFSGNFSFPTG